MPMFRKDDKSMNCWGETNASSSETQPLCLSAIAELGLGGCNITQPLPGSATLPCHQSATLPPPIERLFQNKKEVSH